MKHKKYNSIKRNNTSGNVKLSEYLENLQLYIPKKGLLDKLNFVVTEKVHGCNLSIYFDGNIYKVANRTSFITWDGFMGNVWTNILDKHKSFLQYIYNELSLNSNDYITVYGELAGGIYKGKTAEGSYTIQKEIEYSQNNFFYIFDIYVNNKPLTYTQMLGLCVKFEGELIYAKPLKYGNFIDVKDINAENIKSNIPNWLKEEEKNDTLIEGYIIREVNNYNYKSLPLKWKVLATKFDEDKKKAPSKPKSVDVISLEKLGKELGGNVSELHISKLYGNYGFEHCTNSIDKYTSLLTEDILKNWLNDSTSNRSTYESLNNRHKKILKRSISNETSHFYIEFLNKLKEDEG